MDQLRLTLEPLGATLIGFADLAPVDEQTRQGFPRAVSIGVALTPRLIADLREGPTDEYWAEYGRVNDLLCDLAQAGATVLQQSGHRSLPLRATGDFIPGQLRAAFQHKTAARLAGFGWIGRCALLVTNDYGAAVRWNTILTEAPLPTVAAPAANACGDCRVCVDICPGGAPSGKAWEEGIAREAFFDAEACLRGCQLITARRGTVSRVCGMCVANCPYTVRYVKAAMERA